MKIIILLLTIYSINSYPQFDSLIFSKGMRLNYTGTSIYPLGDQNKDGFDDIMLYDCNEERGYIYFGGSPMDTLPINSIRFSDSTFHLINIAVIDINNDGIDDIVITTRKYLKDIGFYTAGDIRIYFGGNKIDSVPNVIFNAPPGASSIFGIMHVLKDFNSDGKGELVVYDANLPFSKKQFGTLYFYNTKARFDTIPDYIIAGDSVKKINIGRIESSGDINGDGKTDFTTLNSEGEGFNSRLYRSFYLGSSNFDLKPAASYYQDEHLFDVSQMSIINDINGDHRDDILN